MKFYFSGTGNSLYVAKSIGEKDEEVIPIAKLMDTKDEVYEFILKENESIGFILTFIFTLILSYIAEIKIYGNIYNKFIKRKRVIK